MQSLFEWDFYGKKPEVLTRAVARNREEFGPGFEEEYSFIDRLVQGTMEHVSVIDEIIGKAAPEWPIEQITAIDRSVLRLGLYELLFGNHEEAPPDAAWPAVNGRFPWMRGAAMWPCIIDALPPLPDELQYRIVGRDLVLVDVHANLVVDILREALR